MVQIIASLIKHKALNLGSLLRSYLFMISSNNSEVMAGDPCSDQAYDYKTKAGRKTQKFKKIVIKYSFMVFKMTAKIPKSQWKLIS